MYRSITARKFLPRRVTTFPLGWPNTTYTLLLGWHLISNKFLLHQKNFCLSREWSIVYNFSTTAWKSLKKSVTSSYENNLNFRAQNDRRRVNFKKNILSSSSKITMMLTLCEMRFFPRDKWSWYEPHFVIIISMNQTFQLLKTGSNEPCPVFKKRPSNSLTDT